VSAIDVSDFVIPDPGLNVLDHFPILCTINCFTDLKSIDISIYEECKSKANTQFRWDHADLHAYYRFTGIYLEPALRKLNGFLLGEEQYQLTDCTSIIGQSRIGARWLSG